MPRYLNEEPDVFEDTDDVGPQAALAACRWCGGTDHVAKRCPNNHVPHVRKMRRD